MKERRHKRSDQPVEAARLYLQAASRRRGLVALALADADGLLVADDQGPVDAEAVAAIAPLANNRPAERDGLLGLVTRGESLQIWDIELDGDTYYLAGIGDACAVPEDAAEALERILMFPSLRGDVLAHA